ncbi:MAG: D-alanyl-D-alanine carboxypeptidase family protein [Acidimicrobiales bacterium]
MVAGVALIVLGTVVALPTVGVLELTRTSAPPPPPRVVVRPALAASVGVPAATMTFPWPATGQAAVAIPALGFNAQSGPEQPVPVASMTKVMTAYQVLHDHPLTGTNGGPDITITAADAANFATDTVTDQSSVLVTAGEVLTERQMLDAMLVHSANDLAYALAFWDAGTLGTFVAKMNATAVSLGMSQTHFADASGFTPQSMSTASDLLKITSLAMDDPVFAQAVSMPTYTLPVGGTVSTYTPLLDGSTGGVAGVVGVKSGYTTAAGGGDILAYQGTVDGKPLEVLAAVTSQQGPSVLLRCGQIDLGLAQAALADVQVVQPLAQDRPVATMTAGSASSPVVTSTGATLLAMPGQTISESLVVTRRPRFGARAGTLVGTVLCTLGQQKVAVPVRSTRRLRAPPAGHGLS